MILGARELKRRLTGANPLRIDVVPVLRWPNSGDAALDMHIGFQFLFPEKPLVDVIDPAAWDGGIAAGWKNRHVSLNQHVVLHPREFALASTFEYVRLPEDIAAHVVSRSRWARIGLVIAMATFVHPGYCGCLTLELQNLGSAPIKLRPGDAVAQMLFEHCEGAGVRGGSPGCDVGPQPRRLVDDVERRILTSFGDGFSGADADTD